MRMRSVMPLTISLVWLTSSVIVPAFAETSARSNVAILMEVSDAIGPATSDYIQRGIELAAEENAQLVVLMLDTPGGLDSSMRDIIKAIGDSPVPVVTYVAPFGSHAASAGTYILYASHVAAMAPGTNLGAATPVAIGAPGPRPIKDKDEAGDGDEDKEDEASGTEEATAMERKAVNDAVAYIRSLAEERGRNADWAERAVREAVSLSAEAALAEQVVDLIAEDLDDLFVQLNGRTVNTHYGDITLATDTIVIQRFEPDWRTRLLAVITNPSIAYLLLLVGIYGLIFEGYNPGAILPGVVGVICLLLAAFAFQLLPVNYAGLALIGLGVILMIAEVFAPSFGALGIGGIISFVIGSVILIDTDMPGFGIPLSLIISMALVGGLLVFGILAVAIKARRAPVVSGREGLIGSIGEAREDFDHEGRIWIHSELWTARTTGPVLAGQAVRVIGQEGLTLLIRPEPDKEH